jgi:hypothetical protein
MCDDETVVVDASAAVDVSRSSTHDADGEEEVDIFDESMLRYPESFVSIRNISWIIDDGEGWRGGGVFGGLCCPSTFIR